MAAVQSLGATKVASTDQRDRLKEIPVHIELVSYISRG